MNRGRPNPPAASAAGKRRRRAVTPAAAASTDGESDGSIWASLCEELVRLIGWRVLDGDLLDYVRFRAACRDWRSSTDCPRGRGVLDGRFHPRRWMMLPEGHGLHPGHSELGGYIRFFNLSTGAIVRARIPLLSDHCILDSVDGLLLLQRDHDTAVRLLHPFTGDIADLPPVATLRRDIAPVLHQARDWSYRRRISASSVSVSADGVVVVMIAFSHLSRVAFASTTDQQWRYSTWTVAHFSRPLSFQGKIYTLHCRPTNPGDLQIFQIDPPKHEVISVSSPWPEPELIATCPATEIKSLFHLAECDSEILVIGFSDRLNSDMGVYRLTDMMRGRMVPVTSIGGSVLFVGERVVRVGSGVLPASTVAGDFIVHIHPMENYLGQYHLGSRTWLPMVDGRPARGGVPFPCSLVHHIYSCSVVPLVINGSSMEVMHSLQQLLSVTSYQHSATILPSTLTVGIDAQVVVLQYLVYC